MKKELEISNENNNENDEWLEVIACSERIWGLWLRWKSVDIYILYIHLCIYLLYRTKITEKYDSRRK